MTRVWIDGAIRSELSLAPDSPLLGHGDGLFETMLAQDGGLPLWAFHRQRLLRGAWALGLDVEALAERVQGLPAAARALLEAEGRARGAAVVRWTVAGSGAGQVTEGREGVSPVARAGVARGLSGRGDVAQGSSTEGRSPSTTGDAGGVVPGRAEAKRLGDRAPISSAFQWWLVARAHPGAALRTLWPLTEWPRLGVDPTRAIKSTSRAFYTAALQRARAAGADDAIICGADGRVLETTIGNLVVLDRSGEWRTPRADGSFLAGVGLAVLRTAVGIGEADLTVDDLRSAEGVWMTNAVRGPTPVRLVDSDAVPDATRTRDLQEWWRVAVRRVSGRG